MCQVTLYEQKEAYRKVKKGKFDLIDVRWERAETATVHVEGTNSPSRMARYLATVPFLKLLNREVKSTPLIPVVIPV